MQKVSPVAGGPRHNRGQDGEGDIADQTGARRCCPVTKEFLRLAAVIWRAPEGGTLAPRYGPRRWDERQKIKPLRLAGPHQ